MGADGTAVGRTVRARREAGEQAAGFVGSEGAPEDDEAFSAMAAELFGGPDQVVVLVEP